MFHVKYLLKTSPIHRIGLFAAEDICAGALIYTQNLKLDLLLSEEEFTALVDEEKRVVKHYGFFDMNVGKWHLSHDDIRYCNHSPDGTMTLRGTDLVAKRDISSGEELTQDYREFEELRTLEEK
jgi:hypothetical protein